MKIEIKVPQLPESVSEAVLLNWHKKVGEFIKREENLIDLETDKVVLELPAPEDGALVEIVGKPGDTVTSGQLIAYLDTSVKPEAAAPAAKAAETVAQAPTQQAAANVASSVEKVAAMPAAAKVADRKSVV